MARILVVDDLVDNLLLLQAILESEGYEVELASSGTSALAIIEASLPDLVLLDIMMPEMNGLEVTQRLRQNNQTQALPILLVTAYEESSVEQGLKIGANDFIRKPIDIDELLVRIKAFCS